MKRFYILIGLLTALGVLTFIAVFGSANYEAPLNGETQSDVGDLSFDDNIDTINIIKINENHSLQLVRG